jgi:hypothetical protein
VPSMILNPKYFNTETPRLSSYRDRRHLQFCLASFME